jgi:hypothetical protein
MPSKRSWTDAQLIEAVAGLKSYGAVIRALNLIPAGGNYGHVQRKVRELKLDTSHFTGKAWSRGVRYHNSARAPLDELLVKGSQVQSFKLKVRLYEVGLKKPRCEICGWAQISPDGRIPVELDHINGDHYDNRIENLRVLCPNCHSLQLTHRGKNKKVYLRG